MNANDLADKLETEDCCTLDMEAVADMLRQQQEKLTKYELRNIYQCDRIAILETQLRKAQKNG